MKIRPVGIELFHKYRRTWNQKTLFAILWRQLRKINRSVFYLLTIHGWQYISDVSKPVSLFSQRISLISNPVLFTLHTFLHQISMHFIQHPSKSKTQSVNKSSDSFYYRLFSVCTTVCWGQYLVSQDGTSDVMKGGGRITGRDWQKTCEHCRRKYIN
jgi:hypothetical protein